MNVFVGCPTSECFNYRFASSLLSIVNHATQNKISTIIKFQEGNRTDRNRNVILEEALTLEWDYMLWLDTDMVFPADLITKYLEAFKKGDADVIGCLYFKRKYPYAPVGYKDYGTEKGKYTPVHPDKLKETDLEEVVALGYGGMMVKREVYEKLGDDKWTRYGFNFHKPQFCDEEYGSHDVMFCETVRKHGFKIYLHGGIRPTHIATVEIGINDWRKSYDEQNPNVNVIMPTIHPKQAKKTAEILKTRAGYPHKMIVVEDIDKHGFVTICNRAVADNPADYYVYLTDDVFPSRKWLKYALNDIQDKNCCLLGFNDGKWEGKLATCGLVKHDWMLKNYGGDMFFRDYFGHFNDTELTILAMDDKKYCYNPNISLIEVDYDKEKKKVHEKDRKLFEKRKLTNFDYKVKNIELINLFS